MKIIGITSTAILVLLFGVAAPAYAQHEQHEQDAKPPKQEQQAKPEKQQQQAKGQQEQQKKEQQQAKGQQEQQKKQQQQANRPSQQEQRPQQGEQQRGVWQQHRAHNWQSEHRTWQQRGGYRGYRIPDDRFRGYFGPDHGFRIYGLPFLVVGGYPRFQYSGYWFSFVDPWPEYWANDWYDTDDVYVTYVDNGYYLFNRRYPNVGIAISVSM